MAVAAPVGVQVSVTGINATAKAIKAFDPVMYRNMMVAARASAAPVMADAKARSPVRSGAMAGGWTVRKARENKRNGYTFGYVVLNRTRAGAILEHAGSASSGSTPQGTSLISGLNARYGEPGRFAWQAYDRLHDQVRSQFLAAVKAGEKQMQAALAKVV